MRHIAADNRPELTGEFLYQYMRAEKQTRHETSIHFRISEGSIGGRVWRYMQTLNPNSPPPVKLIPFNLNLGQPIEMDDGKLLIVSDIQAPTYDVDWVHLVSPTAQALGIKTLILAGDTINADFHSTHPKMFPQPSAQQELSSARALIEEWLRWFDRIIMLPGNHEDRFLKANAGELGMRELVSLITTSDRVEWSHYDRLFLNSEMGRWVITHNTDYSRTQLLVANKLANKFHCHALVGHQHHAAMGWDEWGRYMLVDNGGLFMPREMAYVNMRTNARAVMKRGFSSLIQGRPTLYCEWTDWNTIFDSPALALA